MHWFKHFSDARHNPKFRMIEKKLGEAGYARAFKLLEIVAERGGKADKFIPELNLRDMRTNLDWLADEWRISTEEAKNTLDTFAAVQLIDPKALRRRIVRIPQMTEYLDEYTQRRQRSKYSRATPERVPSSSGLTPAQSKSKRTEKEAEVESQRKEKAVTAAAALLKKKAEDHWEPLEILPCGSTEFQEIWGTIWGKRSDSEMTSDSMERCIQACKQYAVPVPKPFYDAKRKVESREFDKAVGPEIYDFPTNEVPD